MGVRRPQLQGSWAPLGTVFVPKANCTNCTTGWTTAGEGSGWAHNCDTCVPGYGGANCTICAKGTWSAGGQTFTPTKACTACTGGKTTLIEGATASTACVSASGRKLLEAQERGA